MDEQIINLLGLFLTPIGVWIGFMLAARFSPLAALAKTYPGEGFSGRKFWLRTAVVADRPHRLFLALGADSASLFINMHLLILSGPSPVSIPWSDVEARWEKYGLVKKIALRFKEHPSVPVLISPALAARLAEGSRGHWRVPDEK